MSDDRIERVARAMCEADGKHPDERVPTGRMEAKRSGNAFVQQEATDSAWRKYEKQARLFIAALDAAQRA
jgi:hypothetical protein